VFWEIASREVVWGYDRDEDILNKVMLGKRPTIPTDCPEQYATMIADCWQEKPEKRPSTDKLLKIFAKKGLLESKMADDRKLLSEIQAKCAKQTEEIEIHLQMRDQLQSRLTANERTLTEQTAELANQRRNAEESESRFKREKERTLTLEKELEGTKKELETLRESAQRAEKKLSDKKRSTDRDIRKIQEECEAKLEQLTFDLSRTRRELERERRDKEGLEETIRSMTSRR
jgi:chromosome segregation ATPase